MNQQDLPGLMLGAEGVPQIIELDEPLYLKFAKRKVGVLSQRAFHLEHRFEVQKKSDNEHVLTHASGAQFSADLKERTGKRAGSFRIGGTPTLLNKKLTDPRDQFNLNGRGAKGDKLRAAQVGAVYALLSHWSLSSETATVVLPTGTGKTETMLAATIADNAKRVLVIVPTIELKDQIVDKFSTWGILRDLGVIRDQSFNPTVLALKTTVSTDEDVAFIQTADVVVSTPGLLARADDQILKSLARLFTHIYFDEAHHVKAAEWAKLKNEFTNSKIVQFTATPYRTDRKPIEGKIVYNYPVSRALEDKVFSKISLVSVNERHPKRKDKAIADAAMNRLNEDRKAGWTEHRMMVRCKDQKDAKSLFEKYSSWFPEERIVLIHSKTPDKKSIIKRIKSGAYDIVVCVEMLKEGFDYPNFKVAAVHGVHKSLGVLLQFIGRFTRTKKTLGDASFVVNFADEKMSSELEDLFQDGVGWEQVISEVADAKKAEAESLLAFLQGCEPYSGFDTPDIELNPKLVYPALSCICFRTGACDWSAFTEAFDLKRYALSHPYYNPDENVFYFATQKREKVKWAGSKKVRDQTWDLVVMHYDTSTELLYLGFSEKKLDWARLIEVISGEKANPIKEDAVFRAFHNIKRLSIVHAGIFKPANHLHRYSRLSGADVTTELSRWKAGHRVKKSDFVGVGYRDGFPVSVGASVKGKIWSPARSSDVREWKSWCLNIGDMITDESINSNQLLEDSASKTQLETYPEELIVLATDWSEQLYKRIHKITVERPGKGSFLLSECALQFLSADGAIAKFQLLILDEKVPFEIHLGSEQGHTVVGLDTNQTQIEGLKATGLRLKQFFEENPPTLFMLNGCTIAGCIHTDYGDEFATQIPDEQIEVLDWTGVDFKTESIFKKGVRRENSIQEYVMKMLAERGASIVFNDDNSGESADVVAVFKKEDVIRFEMVHCKYSKEKMGARLSDLYEVCGQAIVSLRYKWNPDELLKHLDRRNGAGVLKGLRFFVGDENKTKEIRDALKYSEVEFEFAVAQPGVDVERLSEDMRNLLGSVYSTVAEMTETKLRCYFNQKSD